MTPAQSIGFLIFVGLPVMLFAGLVVWTGPGPNQQRHLKVVVRAAVGLAVFILLFAVLSVVMEDLSSTPESKSNQFGAGWIFGTIIITLPLTLLDVALFSILLTSNQPWYVRVTISLPAAAVIGAPIWAGLVFVMGVVASQRGL